MKSKYFIYDPIADAAYIDLKKVLGKRYEKGPIFTEELDDCVFIDRDSRTHEIVGIEILYVSELLKQDD